MKKVLVRLSAILVFIAMMAGMILPMTVVANEPELICNSLGAYPYPYPTQGERKFYWGWNQMENAVNSIWYNDSENSFYNVVAPTDGYTDANGVHHPYGVGMHSSIKFTPSTVYSIDSFKITGFKTTVYLVQYDMADAPGEIDITPTENDLVPIVVYLDLGKVVDGTIEWSQPAEEGGEVTYFQEESLLKKDTAGENNAVVLEADAADLEGYTHIRIGIKTRHGIYANGFDGDFWSDWHDFYLIGNTAMASVYFADLEITQSEEVPLITPPSIPERPYTAPAQRNVYEEILPPECDYENWYGKPYGTWKAGSNEKYYLSDMTYLQSCNTPNQNNAFGQPTTVNYPYGGAAGTTFLFGAEGMEHEVEKGIGMHPKHPSKPLFDRTDSWTIYDISAYTMAGADTFYALVGLTALANEWGSRLSSQGVYVYIYGDKVGDGQNYELLAQSDLLMGYSIGEFNVNVTGIKLLLIDVILPETATKHDYSAVGFGNACLFKADANAVKPDYSDDYSDDVYEPDDECYGNYHVYGNNIQQYSSLQHKIICNCGGKAKFESHKWDNGVTSPNGTSIVYTCVFCGCEKTEVVEVHQHIYGNWLQYSTTAHIKLCSCGKDPIYEGHTWDNGVIVSAGTCTQVEVRQYTCTGCGYEKTSATGEFKHVQGNWQRHSSTQHKKTCSCGQTVTYANHIWDNGVITTKPSCTEEGIKTYSCTECGYQKEETIKKTDHAWMEWIIESDTQHKHRCACGQSEKLSHIYDDDKDRFCNDCGYQRVISESTTEPDNFTTELNEGNEEPAKGCFSVTGGALSMALVSLSAAWVTMKKKKSETED